MSDQIVTAGPSYDHETIDAAFGEDSSTGQGRVVLPASLYPVTLAIGSLEGSKNTGTPGLSLECTINEGAFKDTVVHARDTTIWLTPGKPTGAAGTRYLGKLRHMVKQVTGKNPNSAALTEYGFQFNGSSDDMALQMKEQFLALDEQRCEFARMYFRTDEWDRKKVMVTLTCEEEEAKDDNGNPKCDEHDQPIIYHRNSIGNIYATTDVKHGATIWRKMFAAKHKELAESMGL